MGARVTSTAPSNARAGTLNASASWTGLRYGELIERLQRGV
jgi:hypothetical protein